MEKISTNIFDYATSELSQDTFICWLLSWLNNKNENEELYKVTYNFLKYIFEKQGINEKNLKKLNLNKLIE